MGYKSSFKMGKTYGSADLNEITKTFVSGGVGDTFEDGLPYNLKAINDMTNKVALPGVVHETTNTLKASIENGRVKINSGRAIMADGSICIIDEDGVYLDYVTNMINYIYILNDTLANDNVPMCSTKEPSENEDIVMIAQIDEKGILTDKRTFSVGKLNGSVNNFRTMKKKEITFDWIYKVNQTQQISVNVDLGTDAISFLAIYTSKKSNATIYELGIDTYDSLKTITGSGSMVNYQYTVILKDITFEGGTSWRFDYSVECDGQDKKNDGKEYTATYTIYYI